MDTDPQIRSLVDGTPADAISVLDRGLAFGDGVFRTLRIARGKPLNWRRHYERLRADCEALGLAVPDESLLVGEITRVAPGGAIAKVIVTRGAQGRGYAIARDGPTTRIVLAFPPPDYPPELREKGVRVRRCALVLAEQPRLAGAKTLNKLESVLARSEWTDPHIREGLIGDRSGRVIEGTMSNVFVVKAGAAATPDLSRCGVIGAQRERVRDLLRGEGIACVVRDIGFDELAAADEVFLTNSLIGVWPVTALDTVSWRVGPVARRMQDLIDADDAQGR